MGTYTVSGYVFWKETIETLRDFSTNVEADSESEAREIALEEAQSLLGNDTACEHRWGPTGACVEEIESDGNGNDE